MIGAFLFISKKVKFNKIGYESLLPITNGFQSV